MPYRKTDNLKVPAVLGNMFCFVSQIGVVSSPLICHHENMYHFNLIILTATVPRVQGLINKKGRETGKRGTVMRNLVREREEQLWKERKNKISE